MVQKRNFADNAVTIHGEGDFTGLPGILEARMEDGDWRLSLAPGADPQDVFRALAQRPDVKIARFELAEPSSMTYSSQWRPTMHKLWRGCGPMAAPHRLASSYSADRPVAATGSA